MKVPFRLRRTSERRPVHALFLPGRDAAPLLDLCVRLRLDPVPPVFRVQDGYVLRLAAPTTTPAPAGWHALRLCEGRGSLPLTAAAPGVLRLTEVAPGLLTPAEAELIPGLLADEAAALGRRRGLVFLPHGRVLEFDPKRPLPLHELVDVPPLERRAWRPLPEPAARRSVSWRGV